MAWDVATAASAAAAPIAKRPSKKERRDNIFHKPFLPSGTQLYSLMRPSSARSGAIRLARTTSRRARRLGEARTSSQVR